MDIERLAKDIVAKQLEINADDIDVGQKLAEELGADSLDNIVMLNALENQTKISITDSEAANIRTVSDMVAVVERKLSEKR